MFNSTVNAGRSSADYDRAVQLQKRNVAAVQARQESDNSQPERPADLTDTHRTGPDRAVNFEDFYAYSPTHQYIYIPTREMWPAASVDSRLGAVDKVPASRHLDRTRAVEQMTWAPGEPMIISDRLIKDGGWFEKEGVKCFNLYIPPDMRPGNSSDVAPWINHVQQVYPEDAGHIVRWFAHRAQHPNEKINHALVLGGGQGIGKDTLMEPVKNAVGPWNFSEIGPHQLLGRFNGYARSVILRISEARDLGDVDRYSFYERIKTYTAAPPDVLRVDEKNLREYSIPNLCGVIITTNHPDGLYLPADDRRHYVAWSDKTKEDFKPQYWHTLHRWFEHEGRRNVAAYLREVDISDFDAKCPPPQTEAWRRIVDSGRAPEDAELADVIDELGRPKALTLHALCSQATGSFYEWLADRRNRRTIPHRLQTAGYVPVRNDAANDGLWKISGKRQVVYAQSQLTVCERLTAARELT